MDMHLHASSRPPTTKNKTIKPTCLAVIKDCALRPCELDELLIYIVQQTSLTLVQHVQALSNAESPEIYDYQVIHIQRDRQNYVGSAMSLYVQHESLPIST